MLDARPNLCTEEDEGKCGIEFGEKHKSWACKNCKKRKPEQVSPWLSHLFLLRHLLKAGFPFGKNDLSYEEWLDLGLLNEKIESKRVL